MRDELLRAKSHVLRGLTDDELGTLAGFLAPASAKAGDVVVRQQEEEHDLYIVLDGTARVSRNGVDVRTIGVGAHFGEMALVATRHRAATVTATSDLVLARLTHAAYHRLVEHHPRLALKLVEQLAAALADQLVGVTDSVQLMFDRAGASRSPVANVEVVLGREVVKERVAVGTRIDDVVPPEVDGALAVAALLERRPVSLTTPMLADARITALTVASWEGREVWRRSAGLLFLAAARRVVPQAHFALAHSISSARVVRGPSDVDRAEIVREMERLAAARTPFLREQWTVEEARAHFRAAGQPDAADMLLTVRSPTVVVTGLAGSYVHAMGPVLPTAEALRELRLWPHADGLLLDYGPRLSPWVEGAAPGAVELEQEAPRFSSTMAHEHEQWLASMGVHSIGTFNEFCVSGRVRELIRIDEGFHEKHIGKIADAVTARREQVRLICVAGPSSSGKTTFIKRLTVQLEVNGIHPKNLSLDDYYGDRERCPRDERGDYDFEALEALDLALLQEHTRSVLAGKAQRTAHFDFVTGKSSPEGGPVLQLAPGDVLLVEGIHGLNPRLFGDAVRREQMFCIFVQPCLCLPFDSVTSMSPSDVRFIRRIVRDRHSRGAQAQDNISRWASVRRGEGRHIFPNQRYADAVFDSSLSYEMSVLKVYGERYLLEVPADHPSFSTAYRLRHLLDRFVAIYPDHVPPTSILREFIGGSGFEY